MGLPFYPSLNIVSKFKFCVSDLVKWFKCSRKKPLYIRKSNLTLIKYPASHLL